MQTLSESLVSRNPVDKQNCDCWFVDIHRHNGLYNIAEDHNHGKKVNHGKSGEVLGILRLLEFFINYHSIYIRKISEKYKITDSHTLKFFNSYVELTLVPIAKFVCCVVLNCG